MALRVAAVCRHSTFYVYCKWFCFGTCSKCQNIQWQAWGGSTFNGLYMNWSLLAECYSCSKLGQTWRRSRMLESTCWLSSFAQIRWWTEFDRNCHPVNTCLWRNFAKQIWKFWLYRFSYLKPSVSTFNECGYSTLFSMLLICEMNWQTIRQAYV